MHPLEPMAGLLRWAAKNLAYNLKFIPEDKLGWKPSPAANSPLEIVAHVVGGIRNVQPVLAGASSVAFEGRSTPPATLEEAQQLLTEAAEEYAAALTRVPPGELDRVISIGGVLEFPLARAASMPVVDMIHHHGQITYIQAILGDPEFHFFETGT